MVCVVDNVADLVAIVMKVKMGCDAPRWAGGRSATSPLLDGRLVERRREAS